MAMPYFVYSVASDKKLELIRSFDSYREAKQAATAARLKLSVNENRLVRIIFAQNPAEAEELLRTKRERQPSEDDPILP